MNEKIECVLDKYVRPKLIEHCGDVKLLSYKDGVLEIKLLGKCSNCPSSRVTFEDVVEKEIKAHVQEVKSVVLIEGVSDELLSFAKKILNKEII